jgi:PPE-repeat protein
MMRSQARRLAGGASVLALLILAAGQTGAAAESSPAPKGFCADMTKVGDAGKGFVAHPSAATANRVHLAAAIATNSLGQNAPAIMAAEAQYAEMWAHDATAMRSAEGSSSAEAKLQMKATVVLESIDADLKRNCPGSEEAFKLLTTSEKKDEVHP